MTTGSTAALALRRTSLDVSSIEPTVVLDGAFGPGVPAPAQCLLAAIC